LKQKSNAKEVFKAMAGNSTKIVTLNNGKPYFFNRTVFTLAVLALLIIAVVMLALSGFDKSEKIYVSCNKDRTQCDNPLYKNWAYCGKTIDANSLICTQEFLPGGFQYGEPPPLVVQYFASLAFLTLILAFIINHFMFNKHLSKKDFKEVIKEVQLDGVDGDDNSNNRKG
jgi:preprotein translocase subunit SecG